MSRNVKGSLQSDKRNKIKARLVERMKKIYYKKFLPTRRVKVTNFKGVSLDGYSKSLPIDYSLKQENLKLLNGALVSSLSPKALIWCLMKR